MDTNSGPRRLHSHIHLLEFKATFQGLCGWQSQITTCSFPKPCLGGPPSSFALSFLVACMALILPNCTNYTPDYIFEKCIWLERYSNPFCIKRNVQCSLLIWMLSLVQSLHSLLLMHLRWDRRCNTVIVMSRGEIFHWSRSSILRLLMESCANEHPAQPGPGALEQGLCLDSLTQWCWILHCGRWEGFDQFIRTAARTVVPAILQITGLY